MSPVPADPVVSQVADVLDAANKAVSELKAFRLTFWKQSLNKYNLVRPSEDKKDSGSSISPWDDVKQISSLVQDLTVFTQTFEDALRKAFADTLELLKRWEPVFAVSAATPQEKAEFCYLNAKALNAMQPELMDAASTGATDLAFQAVKWLTRALKFDPQLTDAWIEYGESCWRQNNPTEAAGHFRQALKLQPTHVEALCLLSMTLRQLPSTESSELDLITESIQLAQQAVRHEPSSGQAWSVLGNALLTAYFRTLTTCAKIPSSNQPRADGLNPSTTDPSMTNDPQAIPSIQLIVSRCLAAFSQAAKDEETVMEPHFHHNRAIAWHFQRMFSDSLCSWLKAMCLDPAWPTPRVNALRLVNFILRAKSSYSQLVTSNTGGDQNDALVDDFVGPLSACLSLSRTQSNDENDAHSPVCLSTGEQASLSRILGPYYSTVTNHPSCPSKSNRKSKRNRTAKGPSLKFHSEHVKFIMFDQLSLGPIKDSIVVGRVHTLLPSDTDLAMNMLLLDARGAPFVVRLCHIGKGLGPTRKDILTIPNPIVEEFTVPAYLIRAVLAMNSAFQTDKECAQQPADQLVQAMDELQLNVPTDGDHALLDSVVCLRLLRIAAPDILVVNGQPVGSRWTAPPILRTVFFTA